MLLALGSPDPVDESHARRGRERVIRTRSRFLHVGGGAFPSKDAGQRPPRKDVPFSPPSPTRSSRRWRWEDLRLTPGGGKGRKRRSRRFGRARIRVTVRGLAGRCCRAVTNAHADTNADAEGSIAAVCMGHTRTRRSRAVAVVVDLHLDEWPRRRTPRQSGSGGARIRPQPLNDGTVTATATATMTTTTTTRRDGNGSQRPHSSFTRRFSGRNGNPRARRGGQAVPPRDCRCRCRRPRALAAPRRRGSAEASSQTLALPRGSRATLEGRRDDAAGSSWLAWRGVAWRWRWRWLWLWLWPRQSEPDGHRLVVSSSPRCRRRHGLPQQHTSQTRQRPDDASKHQGRRAEDARAPRL